MKKHKYTKSQIYFIFSQVIMFLLLVSCLLFFFLTNDDSQKSRLLFNAIQASMFIVSTIIPRTINKRMKYYVPDFMIIIFDLFCICHFVLGEIVQFYVIIKGWDSILHTLSGFMLGILGFSFIQQMNKLDKVNVNLGPVFCVFFSICFALSIGVLWEIIEFTIDSLFHTNMQRFINDETNEMLIGQNALKDTMKDLILDTIGSSVAAVLGGISIKIKGVAFDKWRLIKNERFLLKKNL